MLYKSYYSSIILCSLLIIVALGCDQNPTEISQPILPLSDQVNSGGWVLNEDISDEFEGTAIDESKWFVQGKNDDYYIWKGRAPSQFAPHNVSVENGKLKIITQWEPDYNFADEEYAGAYYGKYEGQPMPVTTAGIISRKRFLNGYMEVKSKAGNAAITAAFWAIGHEQELDVYELMGKPQLEGNIRENWFKSTVHDWSPPAVRPTRVIEYTKKDLPFRVADEFHVYGAEWGVDYLKLYIDGEMVFHVTQDKVGNDWVLNNPMEVWLDSEIFRWLGMPDPKDLPVEFEIDYVRIWQQPTNNIFDRQFFGFEGPILLEDVPRPLTLLPESSVADDYQKFWLIDTTSAKYLKIVKEERATGVNSLQFTGYGKNENMEAEKIVALTPLGALEIPPGDYNLSMKMWLDQGKEVKRLHLYFDNTDTKLAPFELTGLKRRQWVTLTQNISVTQATEYNSQLRIEIKKEEAPETKATKFYIDDISLIKID